MMNFNLIAITITLTILIYATYNVLCFLLPGAKSTSAFLLVCVTSGVISSIVIKEAVKHEKYHSQILSLSELLFIIKSAFKPEK